MDYEGGISFKKQSKAGFSTGKVMAIAFLGCHGVIIIDYMQKGLHYSKNYRKTATFVEKILFHQDKAQFHTSADGMAKIDKLRFESLDHPPYSPDLPPGKFICSLV